jgi:hypothetical protein
MAVKQPADMREDVESWDVHIERKWPTWQIDGKPWPESIPPVTVRIGVNFLSEASALEFERQVRELLTPEES